MEGSTPTHVSSGGTFDDNTKVLALAVTGRGRGVMTADGTLDTTKVEQGTLKQEEKKKRRKRNPKRIRWRDRKRSGWRERRKLLLKKQTKQVPSAADSQGLV